MLNVCVCSDILWLFFNFKLRADLMTQRDRHAFIFIFPFVLLFIAIFRGRLEAEQLCAAPSSSLALSAAICGLIGGSFRSRTCWCAFWRHSHNLLPLQNRSRCFAATRADNNGPAFPTLLRRSCSHHHANRKLKRLNARCFCPSAASSACRISLRVLFLFKGYQEISLCNTRLLFEKLFLFRFLRFI